MQESKKTIEEKQLILQENASQLPSAEVRETFLQQEDEIDLREILDVLIRRKWLILSILLFFFLLAGIYTVTRTPQFKANGSLKVSPPKNTLDFDRRENTGLRTIEFQQTQVKMLQSEQLANRVIDYLHLTKNKVFNPDLTEGGERKEIGGILKGIIRSEEVNQKENQELNEKIQERISRDAVLQTFNKRFSVSPVKNSELIEISFFSPDPELSAEITNAAMEQFVNMHMDGNLKVSQDSSRFLDKQIKNAQINLEKSEQNLQAFARKIGVVSLDPKTNMTLKQMEELNEALAKARAERIAKEGRYQQNRDVGKGELTQVMDNQLIQNLKNQHATLKAEYENLAITFKSDYPKMRQLKARMDDIDARIALEKKAIFDSIKNEYDTALKVEKFLEERTEDQKQKSLDLEKQATQYKIFEREVETNKSIYQSLLQRSKEIQATVGAAMTNIQIIDTARPPLYPFKPKVALNLLLGSALGLMIGIGLAFLLEFFDTSIKGADELTRRFQIPVLGFIPYDKECVDDRQSMAFKFHKDPRSPVAEAVRTAIASVRLSVADDPPKSILMTSILAGAGKSSLSVNTALSFLAEDERCILVDVDLRKPSLHKIFERSRSEQGLSTVLTQQAKLHEVITPTQFDCLHVITSGPLPPNPADLLSSKRMRQLLEVLTNKYDKVILDGPPYQGFAEILVLANMVDGVILIVDEGKTPRDGVKHLKQSVANVGGRLLGAIINRSGKQKRYGGYGGYNYYSYNYDDPASLQSIPPTCSSLACL